jgi:hypothetical protein
MLSPGKDALGHATYEHHRTEQTLLYQLIEKLYPALIEQLDAQVTYGAPLDSPFDPRIKSTRSSIDRRVPVSAPSSKPSARSRLWV